MCRALDTNRQQPGTRDPVRHLGRRDGIPETSDLGSVCDPQPRHCRIAEMISLFLQAGATFVQGRKYPFAKIVEFHEILAMRGGEITGIPHLLKRFFVRRTRPHFPASRLALEGVS